MLLIVGGGAVGFLFHQSGEHLLVVGVHLRQNIEHLAGRVGAKLDRDGDSSRKLGQPRIGGGGIRYGVPSRWLVPYSGGTFPAEGRKWCRRRGKGDEEWGESLVGYVRSLADRAGPRGFSLSPVPQAEPTPDKIWGKSGENEALRGAKGD